MAEKETIVVKKLMDMAKNSRAINPCKKGMKESSHNGWELYNDDWFLSPEGDMYASYGRYSIIATRLKEDDWFLHLMGKTWFDANTFIPAYFEACQRAGITEVKISLSY